MVGCTAGIVEETGDLVAMSGYAVRVAWPSNVCVTARGGREITGALLICVAVKIARAVEAPSRDALVKATLRNSKGRP